MHGGFTVVSVEGRIVERLEAAVGREAIVAKLVRELVLSCVKMNVDGSKEDEKRRANGRHALARDITCWLLYYLFSLHRTVYLHERPVN